MKRLRFSPKALADLAAIHAYISDDSPAAAKRVVRTIIGAMARLKPFPHSGRKGLVNATSELVVPKLSFIVVYIVVRDTVKIIAIVHVTRNERNRDIK